MARRTGAIDARTNDHDNHPANISSGRRGLEPRAMARRKRPRCPRFAMFTRRRWRGPITLTAFPGKNAGLYEKIGLDPEFLFISGSAATLQLLISGDADIGNIGILEFIASKKKQPTLPLSVVYCHDYRGSYVTIVPEDSPIKTRRRLQGQDRRRAEPRRGNRADLEGDGARGRHRSCLDPVRLGGRRRRGHGRAEIRPRRCLLAFHRRDRGLGKHGHEVPQLRARRVLRRVRHQQCASCP